MISISGLWGDSLHKAFSGDEYPKHGELLTPGPRHAKPRHAKHQTRKAQKLYPTPDIAPS